MAENDIERLKEFMFRSSEQMKYLTEKVDSIEGKVDLLIKDVIILKVKAWGFGIIGGAIVTAIFEIAIKFLGK